MKKSETGMKQLFEYEEAARFLSVDRGEYRPVAYAPKQTLRVTGRATEKTLITWPLEDVTVETMTQ